MTKPCQAAGSAVAVAVVLFGVSSELQSPARSAIPDLGIIQYNEPPTTSPTGSRVGGASKGDCPGTPLPLTPLAPTKQEMIGSGRTIAQHPKLWFYSPYTRDNNLSLQFELRNYPQDQAGQHNGTVVYSTGVLLPAQPGLIGVQIPAAIALQPKQTYKWSLKVACGDPPLEIWSWIERIDPTTAAKSSASSPAGKSLQQAVSYAKNALWFDAVTTLVELHRAHPQDQAVKVNLKSLLTQGGVAEKVAEAAIAEPPKTAP